MTNHRGLILCVFALVVIAGCKEPHENTARQGIDMTLARVTQALDGGGDGGGGSCGNGTCDPQFGEDSYSCSQDCYCGDGVCEGSESSKSCATDCR